MIEVSVILPSHTSPDRWDVKSPEKIDQTISEYLSDIDDDVYLLGFGYEPNYIEDITGSIHDEPDFIYASVSRTDHTVNPPVTYFGINKL